MMPNFTAWCLQVAAVVALAAALPRIVRLRAPRPLLAYWHTVLIVCVALPLLQFPMPRRTAANPAATAMVEAYSYPARLAAERSWPIAEIGAAALAAGALVRFLWLCAGMLRLRRYRRSARPFDPLPGELRQACGRLGVHPDLYFSPEMTSPVTFGLRRPAILLPESFPGLAPEERHAILCHELLHVRRRDWLFTIAEEFIRCALWFHPAIWWLLGRIQLTREQVVDRAAIEHTGEPDRYLDALIAVASRRLRADLAPAPLFLKKRHLRERVASIVKGVPMSKRNLLLSSLAVFSALPLIVGIAAWQFPLQAASHKLHDDPGVEVKQGQWKLLYRTGIAYPAEAREKSISGTVIVKVDVNEKGDVTDARILSGDPAFRKAVLEAVLDWRFLTDPARPMPQALEIAVDFDAARAAAAPLRVGGDAQQAKLIQRPLPVYPPEAKQAGIQGRVRLKATIDEQGRIANLELVSGPPELVQAAMQAVQQWVYEPTWLNGKPVAVITNIDVNFTLSDQPPKQ